jgi:hypothetical protein
MCIARLPGNRNKRPGNPDSRNDPAAAAGRFIRPGAILRAALVVLATAGWLGAQDTAGKTDAAGPLDSNTFSPLRYVRLFEDTGTRRILIYDPLRNQLHSSQIKVDGRSTIYIEVAGDLIDQNIPMNRLFMTATLARGGGQSEQMEVVGYSEVGRSQEGAESQSAVALQTAEDVQLTLLNMFFTTGDLIRTFYGGRRGCPEKLARDPQDECGKPEVKRSVAEARFRLYRPEIQAITEFFVHEDTARVASLLGSQAFGVDIASLKAIARQYLDNVTALFDPDATAERQTAALSDLVERTKLIWHDFSYIADELHSEERKLLTAIAQNQAPACFSAAEFGGLQQRYREALAAKPTADEHLAKSTLETAALNCYTQQWGKEIAAQLQQYLVPAQIFLGANDVKPGDTVTLRIEAKESAGAPIGVPAQFLLIVRDRGVRVAVSPSLFFIKRLNVTAADIDISQADAIKAVDFSPFPGVTFGAVFHSRGLTKVANKAWDYEALETAGSRFLGALAPGVGINVTFMNFGDPRDFNPTANDGAGAFTTTSGANFEVGAGVVGSLFNNNLQFTYGYNLNAGRKNSYFGVGFGFIEVGKRLAGFLGQ